MDPCCAAVGLRAARGVCARTDRFAAGYLTRARCAEIVDVQPLSNDAICAALCNTTTVEVSCVVALPDDAFHTNEAQCGLPPRF